MESVIKGAAALTGPAAQVIEIQEAIPVPEPEAGFPWCGVGIGVGVIAAAAVCAKLYKCTSKK